MSNPTFIEAADVGGVTCYINTMEILSVQLLAPSNVDKNERVAILVHLSTGAVQFANGEADKFLAYAKNQAYDPNAKEVRKITYDHLGRPVNIEMIHKSDVEQATLDLMKNASLITKEEAYIHLKLAKDSQLAKLASTKEVRDKLIEVYGGTPDGVALLHNVYGITEQDIKDYLDQPTSKKESTLPEPTPEPRGGFF